MGSFLDKLFHKLRSQRIIKHIPESSFVCDIGCGAKGPFLKEISSRIRYGIGLDKKAEEYHNSKIEIKQINISKNIPLDDDKFDSVLMIAVLEHLDYPQEILSESFRILKKGGNLILTAPTPLAKPILEILSFKLRLIDKNEISDHKNYFWPKDIKKMLLKAKFRKENIKTRFFNVFFNSFIICQK